MRVWIDNTMAELRAYAVSRGYAAAGPSADPYTGYPAGTSGDPFSSPSDSFPVGYGDLSPSTYPSPYGGVDPYYSSPDPYGGVDPSYVDEPYSG